MNRIRSLLFVAPFFILSGCVSTEFDFRNDAGEAGRHELDSALEIDANSLCVKSCPTATVCDPTNGSCVECFENRHCTSEIASTCIDHRCKPCTENADCSHISGLSACRSKGTSSASCVQCTPEAEEACGEFSCDAKTNRCTSTKRGTRTTCQSCVADSECVLDHRCIVMNFKGALLSGFCLPSAMGTCPSPYPVTIKRPSLSGYPSSNYCAINEQITTCSALFDIGKACSTSDDCGLPGKPDGVCGSFLGTLDRICSQGCTDQSECPVGGFFFCFLSSCDATPPI